MERLGSKIDYAVLSSSIATNKTDTVFSGTTIIVNRVTEQENQSLQTHETIS